MKREYEAPMMHCEEFVPNQYIAGCGDTNITAEIAFRCFNGPKIDGLANVLSDSAGSECDIQAKYVSSTHVSKPGYTDGNAGTGLDNEHGFFVICYNEITKKHDITKWNSSTGIHSDSHKPTDSWHCMATPAGEGEIELYNYS